MTPLVAVKTGSGRPGPVATTPGVALAQLVTAAPAGATGVTVTVSPVRSATSVLRLQDRLPPPRDVQLPSTGVPVVVNCDNPVVVAPLHRKPALIVAEAVCGKVVGKTSG